MRYSILRDKAHYRETHPSNNKQYVVLKERCTCDCHKAGMAIMHFMACCEGGFVYHRKMVKRLGWSLSDRGFAFIVPRSFHLNKK